MIIEVKRLRQARQLLGGTRVVLLFSWPKVREFSSQVFEKKIKVAKRAKIFK